MHLSLVKTIFFFKLEEVPWNIHCGITESMIQSRLNGESSTKTDFFSRKDACCTDMEVNLKHLESTLGTEPPVPYQCQPIPRITYQGNQSVWGQSPAIADMELVTVYSFIVMLLPFNFPLFPLKIF